MADETPQQKPAPAADGEAPSEPVQTGGDAGALQSTQSADATQSTPSAVAKPSDADSFAYEEISGTEAQARKDVSLLGAAFLGDVEEVVRSIAKRAKAIVKWPNGDTTMHVGGHKDVVLELLKDGADVSARDADGWTSLCSACIGGHYDVVELLLHDKRAIATISATENNGFTPLYRACNQGYFGIVQPLLGHDLGMKTICFKSAKNSWTSPTCNKPHVAIPAFIMQILLQAM
ncbi:hypothetical protein AJ80_01490 [Polytolypa hystricis UAMH7299]|uniref:Uncharacterized protein n=1 Tax=Polytolypa hystricis (strain UAMH7299) TaxID=1447883 RepID=A0A2B7Z240_POLH7|nr:hypothetical protein AJ80_01490 [Polytolypa hystricis UAMH7299]